MASDETEIRDLDTLVVTPEGFEGEESEDNTVNLSTYRPSYHRTWDLLHTSLKLRFDWQQEHVLGIADIKLVPLFYAVDSLVPVSYTHLDVYKRQEYVGKYMTLEGRKLIIGYENGTLYYEWNGIEKRNFFPLSRLADDYFTSLPFNVLFVRNDAGQITKAWCQMSGDVFWVYKIRT